MKLLKWITRKLLLRFWKSEKKSIIKHPVDECCGMSAEAYYDFVCRKIKEYE